jgi:hypothetical protein
MKNTKIKLVGFRPNAVLKQALILNAGWNLKNMTPVQHEIATLLNQINSTAVKICGKSTKLSIALSATAFSIDMDFATDINPKFELSSLGFDIDELSRKRKEQIRALMRLMNQL